MFWGVWNLQWKRAASCDVVYGYLAGGCFQHFASAVIDWVKVCWVWYCLLVWWNWFCSDLVLYFLFPAQHVVPRHHDHMIMVDIWSNIWSVTINKIMATISEVLATVSKFVACEDDIVQFVILSRVRWRTSLCRFYLLVTQSARDVHKMVTNKAWARDFLNNSQRKTFEIIVDCYPK